MSNLKVPVTESDHRRGNEDAPIVLVEYGDYQCPHCAKAHVIVNQLLSQFGDQLQYVFRNFPLVQIHPAAKIAAETAEFSADEGRFWEMHDLIFENQNDLNLSLLLQLTERLHLPTRDLKISLEKGTYDPKIKSDFLGGVKSGVNGTPTFFINGQRHNGSYQFDELAFAIDSVVNR